VSIDPITAQDKGRHYARQLEVPFVFLSNGEEVRFLDRDADTYARTGRDGDGTVRWSTRRHS